MFKLSVELIKDSGYELALLCSNQPMLSKNIRNKKVVNLDWEFNNVKKYDLNNYFILIFLLIFISFNDIFVLRIIV